MNEELKVLQENVACFAQRHIGCRHDLLSMDGFPYDIWTKLGDEKLLGLGISKEYGGLGGNYLSIAVAGEALIRNGRNMGIGLSWLTHHAVSRFLILGFGTKEQQEKYLHKLARGVITASIAVSEPGRGAHPKYLEASAYRWGDSYVLKGGKTYLTNGPIADLFIVVVSTGEDEKRKRFTAFIVPKDTEGLSVNEPMKLDFFRPAPHGGITLSDCIVPASNILGKECSAYDDMVKPFGEVEDVLMMGLMVGGMEWQLELFLGLVAEQGIDSSSYELKRDLGELQSIVDTLRIIAYESASMLDGSVKHAELISLLICFRNLSRQFQDLLERRIEREKIGEESELHSLTKELSLGMRMGDKGISIKQGKLGEMLLTGKDAYERP